MEHLVKISRSKQSPDPFQNKSETTLRHYMLPMPILPSFAMLFFMSKYVCIIDLGEFCTDLTQKNIIFDVFSLFRAIIKY